MVFVLLFIALKNFFKKKANKPVSLPEITTVFILIFLCTNILGAQIEKRFSVFRNNNEIGFIQIEQTQKDNRVVYELNSEINTRFVLSFSIEGKEVSIYDDGKLTYSSIKRFCNNKTKVNKELQWLGEAYVLRDKNKTKQFPYTTITQNLVTLYFQEPKTIKRVYCDNYNTMGTVIPLEDHAYKIVFPDGNYNIFYYKQQKLERIEVFHTLYRVDLVSL